MTSLLARQVSGRYGARVIAIGASLGTAGLVVLGIVLAWRGADLASWQLLPSMILVGAGNGLVLPSLVGSVLAGIKAKNAGAASGMLVTAQQFGGASGVTILGTVFFSVLGSHPGGFGGYVSAMRWVDAVDVVFVLAILAMAFLLPKQAAGMAAKRWPSSATAPASARCPAGSLHQPIRPGIGMRIGRSRSTCERMTNPSPASRAAAGRAARKRSRRRHRGLDRAARTARTRWRSWRSRAPPGCPAWSRSATAGWPPRSSPSCAAPRRSWPPTWRAGRTPG